MSVAIAQVLEGVPDPAQLRLAENDGRTVITVGSRVLVSFASGDLGMRNVALVTLTDLGFQGKDVAAVMGLTPQHVSAVRGRVRDEGAAGLVRERGRPKKLTPAQVEQARVWRREGVSDVAIAERLGVDPTTIGRRLRGQPAGATPSPAAGDGQGELPVPEAASPEPEAEAALAETSPQVEVEPQVEPAAETGVEPDLGVGGGAFAPAPGSVRIRQGVVACRWAGAMLVHAFTHRLDAGGV